MQMIQLDSWLSRMGSRLPAELAPSFQTCLRVAAHFRSDTMAVLEEPLGRAPSGLDFSVRLEQEEQSLVPEHLPTAVRTLFARREAGTFRRECLPSIWLEYDLRQGEGREPISCYRLGPEVEPAFVFQELLPVVGSGLAAQDRRTLHQALAALPPKTRLLYLFDLGARGRTAVRCEIAGEPRLLGSWLESIGASVQAAQLRQLSLLAGDGNRPHVSVDFDGAWAPRVGLENSFRGQPQELRPWRKWFETLAEAGLILPEQIGALLAWPVVETPDEAKQWPMGEDGRAVPGWSVACLSHLKLALMPDAQIEVKAYRLFQQRPREVREPPRR